MDSQTTQQLHVVIASFPGQGHINPLIRLAKRLASKGLLITFCTSLKKIVSPPTSIGTGKLQFEFFSDGWEDDHPQRPNLFFCMNQMQAVGRDSFTQLLKQLIESGPPVSCIINNPFIPWVTDVASDLGIPSAVLWVQSCAMFSIYYHYFHNLVSTADQSDLPIHIPGLPVLKPDEIPAFLLPTHPKIILETLLGQYGNLSKTVCVFVDSFQELEQVALQPILDLGLSPKIRPIGPLFKYETVTDNDVKDDCIDWLDNQAPSSVVYVCFGSHLSIKNSYMEEVAKGLLMSGMKFLWVVRPSVEEDKGKLPEGFLEEVEGKGKIFEWSPQVRVLSHTSVACYVTHCGWSSSMETLACGVPVVTFPQWGDQVNNGKFLVDVFGVGVKLIRSDLDLDKLTRDDVARCIGEVMSGPKSEEYKKNSLKWKKAAEEAVADGGSSDKNVDEFIDEIRQLRDK